MTTALGLPAVQGALGAFDTLHYHEWRALIYGVVFAALPRVEWRGAWPWRRGGRRAGAEG